MPESIKKIQVMVVEDHPKYREVMELALNKDPQFESHSQFGTAERALRYLQELRSTDHPSVILLDLNLPGISGLDSIRWIKEYAPESKIIVLTQSDKDADVLKAIKAGASGYLLKSSSVSQIKEGIQSVMTGGASLDSSLTAFILKTIKSKLPESGAGNALTDREVDVLKLLAEGYLKKEIASLLGISNTTVVTHVNHIYEKLDARNAPAAIAKAYRFGIFSPGKAE